MYSSLAVLAENLFKKHHCIMGGSSELEVEIRSSVTHTVTLRKVQDWLNGGAKTPKEAVTKEPVTIINKSLITV